MSTPKILITDHGFPNADAERRVLAEAGFDLVVAQCRTPAEVIAAAAGASALLVQWAPITADVLRSIPQCRVIVRYGIGVDNVDLAAARQLAIPVCNVPDYGVAEVSEHAIALALALSRQLPQLDDRFRRKVWKHVPDAAMSAFAEVKFVTAGFGRIAQSVHAKIRTLGFRQAAYDPLIPDEVFRATGVERIDQHTLFRDSDILSLHLPLLPETRHFVGKGSLAAMKPSAILVNTARGGLVDTDALVDALVERRLAGAGLDVFEDEPISPEHRLYQAPNTILTSHVAWYSESSISRLQRMAAEEVVRALQGKPLRSQVNR
jgi:D-3-phosphoglycerate dehydrogenase